MQLFAYLTSMMSSMVPLAQEFYLFLFFCLGFVLFRMEAFQRLWRGSNQKEDSLAKSTSDSADASESKQSFYSLEQLRNDFELSRYEYILDGWPFLEEYTAEALNLVVAALLALNRPDDVGLFVAKAAANLPQLRQSLHLTISMIAAPPCQVQHGHIATALRDVYEHASDDLDAIAMEALLIAFARLNDEARVSGVLQRITTRGASASPDSLSGIVRSFLENKNLDAALGFLQVLASQGSVGREVAIAAVRISTEAPPVDECMNGIMRPRTWDVLDILEDIGIPVDAAMLLLEWSAKQMPVDILMASRVEKILRAAGPLPWGAFDALVRVHASPSGDQMKARNCFNELASNIGSGNNRGPSEGSLVGMISACAEAKNGALAEHILQWAREHKRCTLPVFSSGVKVLAAAKQPERICILYKAASAEGLTLDDALYGQLIKFAVQAGQLDLARQLFQKARNPDALNYMSLIRACGQEGNVPQALEMLRELRNRGSVDTAAYNCALDVCISCGDHVAAKTVFEEMKVSDHVDVISYNTLMKQHVGEGGSSANAEALLEEMRLCGIKPNIATYNSLLSGAIAVGDLAKAWRCIDVMESSKLGVDSYTISILFKGFRKEGQSFDKTYIDRALALLRKHSVKVDEVLMSAVLEACSRLKDPQRLINALDMFKQSGWTMPKECAMHTYGTLIKAYGQSRQLPLAWKLWRELTSDASTVPSEQIYGQMIDALVTNGRLDDAVSLLTEMKQKHAERIASQGFAVAYAMIIRGYAQRKECARALACYDEMITNGTKVSIVVFNTLIDACSRVGDMESAARLFREMVSADCVPDLITYSTLIKGYCVCGEMDQAMQLFIVMRKKGIQPDAIVYNSLLDGCAKKQMQTLCEQVVRDMEDASVKLSNHSVSILVKLYGRVRNLDAACKVVDEIPKKYGFQPNVAVYTCLMSACIANGRLDKAMDLRLRMLEERQYPDAKTYATLLRGLLKSGSVEQCVMIVQAALDQGGRCLVDEELIQSLLILIQQRRLWDEHGRFLMERLREAGIHAQMPQVPSTAASRGSMMNKHPAGRLNNSQAQRNRVPKQQFVAQQNAMWT